MVSNQGIYGGMQSRYLTNNYNSAAGLDAGSFGDAPLFSFGSQGAYGLDSGLGGFMGSMNTMNPMMMGSYGQDPTAMINYQKQMTSASMTMQEDMERYQIEKQGRQQRLMKSAEFTTTSPETQVMEKINVLKDLVDNNEQKLIPGAHDELVKAVKDMYPEPRFATPTEKAAYQEQLKAMANKLYTSATGKEIAEHLQERGNTEIGQGIGEGLFGIGFLANDKNYKDSRYHITGQAVSQSDEVQRWTGRILGVGLSIAAVVLLRKSGGKLCHEIGTGFSHLKLSKAENAIEKAERYAKESNSAEAMDAVENATETLTGKREAFNEKNAQWWSRRAERQAARA